MIRTYIVLKTILVFICANTIVEYRLWYNFGQVINDYSGNGWHAVYGTSYLDIVKDPVPTPKGAYFYAGNTITMPPNDFVSIGMRSTNNISLIFWMFNPSNNSGMFFYRYGLTNSSENIQISIVNTNQVSVAIQQRSLSDSHTFQSLLNNTIWNLIVISFSGSNINLNINTFDTETYSINTFIQEDSTQTYGMNIMNPQLGINQTYIFSLVIIDTEAVSTNYYNTQDIHVCVVRLCNEFCTFAAITSLGNGCISTLTSPYKGLGGADWRDKCGASFGADEGICYNCSSSCSPNTCRYSNNQILCLNLTQPSCSAGYDLLNYNSTCLQCNSDCSTCTNSTTCSTCKDSRAVPSLNGCACVDGYYNSSSLASNDSCLPCRSDCTQCNHFLNCTRCKDTNASINPLGCVCNDRYYNSTPLTNNGLCLKCNLDCISSANLKYCNSFTWNYVISNNTGCLCESGYTNTTYSSNHSPCFSHCGPGCLSCNETLCLSCNYSNSYPIGKSCACKDGFWLNESSFECIPCDSQCLTCDRLGCLSCSDPHASAFNHNCVCNPGFYNETSNSTCVSCNSSCSICDNPTTCLQCKDQNAQLIQSECFCKKSYLLKQNSCMKCSKIYNFTTDLCYCPNLCTDCIGTQCTSCVENASLMNNKCACDISFFGNTSCEFSNFILSVTLNSQNSLLLSFFDEPLSPLIQKSISIFISNLTEYSFNLIQYSISSYKINITYNQDIGNNCVLNLKFLHPVYSIHNGNLTTLEYSFSLPATVLDYKAAVSYQSEQTASTTTQGCTFGSFFVSLLNLNFLTLWNFLNIIQLLCYIRLSDVVLPPKFDGQLKGLKKFNMIPNIFEYFFTESQYSISNPKYSKFGYKSSILFFNVGSWMTSGLVLFIVFVLSLIFSRFACKPFSFKMIKEKIASLLQSFKYGKLIRYLIQTYLDYFASATIALLLFKINTTLDIINIAFCIFILAILLVTPFLCLKITVNRTKEDNKKEGLTDVFSTLFSEFSKEKSLSSSLYYCLFFIRRILLLVFILLVPNQPLFQLTLNFILSFSVTFI